MSSNIHGNINMIKNATH